MIRTAVHDLVARLTLDRPERRNAMSRDMLLAIARDTVLAKQAAAHAGVQPQ